MIRAEDLIAKFRQALEEGWGYIWGQAGGTWTQTKQAASTRPMTVRYGSRWIGKKVADCSGLFAWAFRALGGSIYHGSNTIWKRYCTKQGRLTEGVQLRPGTAVFLLKNGNRHHIGLYIGHDTVIEARSTESGVVTSRLNHWDEWGELQGVLYDGEAVEAFVPVLRKGCRGNDVKKLQEALLRLGYALPRFGADGKYGAETRAAVIAFQKKMDIAVDGICGANTWTALKKAIEQKENTPDEHVRRVVITAESAVSIRTGNGKDYPEARRVNPGETFDWVATAENGWFALKLVNYVGWIDGKYCRIE